VTAPIFWLDGVSLASVTTGAVVVLDGPEGRHAATVRRIGVGECVDLSDGEGRVARCRVESTERDLLRLLVDSVETLPAPSPAFVLVQALAKHGRDELAVETATEVGVDGIVPWQAERSVVVWRGDRGEKSRHKWVDTAKAAAKQSRRVRVPAVEPAVTTSQLVQRLRQPQVTAVFVLHESAQRPLSSAQLPDRGEVLLLVGPEGGVSPQELDLLTEAGAQPVVLGREVLRSSTAGTAAIVALAVRSGRW
jgi:16S rRNA (uracil1498-N3)-methyltransferase